MIRRVAFALFIVGTFLGSRALFAQQVVVMPEETDEILANPGMGWETFHHMSKQDKNLPSWIPSTIQYARWGWGELEPQPGLMKRLSCCGRCCCVSEFMVHGDAFCG